MGNKKTSGRRKKRRVFHLKKKLVVDCASHTAEERGCDEVVSMEVDGECDSIPSTSASADAMCGTDPADSTEALDETTASKRKLGDFAMTVGTPHYDVANHSEPYKVLSDEFVKEILKFVCCSECGTVGENALEEGRKQGLASHYKLVCYACGYILFSSCSSPSALHSRMLDINARFVYACKNSGLAYEQACTFIADLNLPSPPSATSYQQSLKKLYTACEVAMDEHQRLIKTMVRSRNAKDSSVLDDDSVVDIKVSFDGTWQKRGHVSHNGVVTTIDALTGYVVDFEVLSNFCLGCKQGPKEGEEGYEEFMEKHICQRNTDVKSGAMESEGALKIWNRTVGSNVHYVAMLSDGDSNSFKTVEDAKPYGETKPVLKEECINHVAKRLTARLKKLVANTTVDDGNGKQVPLGGVNGFLTDNYIIQLQNYYRGAIKNNPGDVVGMRRAILATLYHTTGKSHDYCPVDEWCYVHNSTMKEPKYKTDLPANYFDLLKPIYEDLSTDELLTRCSSVSTQNANESVNAEIWRRSPKVGWCSRKSVYVGTCMAIIGFNAGAKEVCSIQRHFGLRIGKNTAIHAGKKDSRRIQGAERRSIANKGNSERRLTGEDRLKQKEKVAKLEKTSPSGKGKGKAAVKGKSAAKGKSRASKAYLPGGY